MKSQKRTKVMSAFAVFKSKKLQSACRDKSSTIRKAKRKLKRRKHEEEYQISENMEDAIPKNMEEELNESSEDNRSGIESEASSFALSPIFDRHCELPCGNIYAEKCFDWLVEPISRNTFFKEVWEKKPLQIRRAETYYQNIFTCEDFQKILKQNIIYYTTSIDVVEYVNGERRTSNPDGRAYASTVWNYFRDGYSIRMRNPQAYHHPLWKLISLLQEYLGCSVGVNMYLTPPESQGFAPHFDDIDAFVLQLEGRKIWKLHPHRSEADILPRFSSGNLSPTEIAEPTTEFELLPGHLLYFPRGQIHQAKTLGTEHSLHLTISAFQKVTWGDLLLTLLPSAVEKAMERDLELRRAVPKDLINFVGVANSDDQSPQRDMFLKKIETLSRKVLDHLPIDEAVDNHAKDFIHASVPPVLTKRERSCSIHSNGNIWRNGKIHEYKEFTPNTRVRLIRKQAVRVVHEKDGIKVYHTLENSKNYKEFEINYVDIEPDGAVRLHYLFRCYPKFVPIKDLPISPMENKMLFAEDMFANGLLMIENIDHNE